MIEKSSVRRTLGIGASLVFMGRGRATMSDTLSRSGADCQWLRRGGRLGTAGAGGGGCMTPPPASPLVGWASEP